MVVRALKPPQNKSTRNRRSISWHHRRRPCSTSCVVCALLSSSALTMTRLRCGGDEFGHPRPCTHSAFRDGCSACAPALIDRECARARVLSRCEDNGADAARSRATCDGTVCCASPRGADGGGSAVGAPAPSQATQWRRCAIRVDSRRSASSRFPRGGAPLGALVHRCDAAVVSRAATPRHCRLSPGCLCQPGCVCSAGFFEPTGRRGCVCSSGFRARR
jgi:hypothetical protein